MLVLGVDFETSGLLVDTDRIIEVGAVLWSTNRNAPLQIMNEFVNPGIEVSEEITRITGITNEDIAWYGDTPYGALVRLSWLMDKAEVVVAHNGNQFDRPLFEAECRRNGLEVPNKHWLDTSIDLPYPPHIQTRKLTHLAAEHSFVNPFPHRAFSDVLTMLKILSFYDINETVRVSKLPSVKVAAITKKPWEDPAPEGKKETDLAKARGYRWDGGRKLWLKTIKEHQLQQEIAEAGFQIRVVV